MLIPKSIFILSPFANTFLLLATFAALPLTDFACLRGLLPSSSYQSYLKLTAYALNLYGLLLEPSPPDSIPSSELRERTGTAPNAENAMPLK